MIYKGQKKYKKLKLENSLELQVFIPCYLHFKSPTVMEAYRDNNCALLHPFAMSKCTRK